MITATKVARVLLVDDQTLFRTGLARLLEGDPRIEIVGQAADGAEAVIQAEKLRPDVVLMDLKMPNVDGIEATRQMIAANPDTRVLILTTFETDNHVIQALKAGASGYVLKDSLVEAIVSSVLTEVLNSFSVDPAELEDADEQNFNEESLSG